MAKFMINIVIGRLEKLTFKEIIIILIFKPRKREIYLFISGGSKNKHRYVKFPRFAINM